MKAKFVSNEVKYPSTTLTLLTIPEGYMLVEFFGTHDFGWLREESTIPMTIDDILTVPDGTIGTVLYFTVLFFTVLYRIVLHCTVLYCTVLHCNTVLYCVLHSTLLFSTVLKYTALYCTVLCTTLYCTVRYI
jgi:hypothetical protein